MDNERVLISEVISGNQAAFQTFVKRYQKLVAHVVYRLVADRADREDLCQEVFIKVYRHLAGFQNECKLSTWLARVAYNTCLHHLDKRKIPLLGDLTSPEQQDAISQPAEGGLSPADRVEQRDINQRVRDEVNSLPPQYGVFLALYHLEQMSYEEIAEVTRMPLGTVKSYLFRARKMLKDRLLAKYELEDIWR